MVGSPFMKEWIPMSEKLFDIATVLIPVIIIIFLLILYANFNKKKE